MNRHPQPKMINVKRRVKNRKNKARILKTGIKDLRREKDEFIEITKILLDKFREIKTRVAERPNSDKGLNDLIRRLNGKIDTIKQILVGEQTKTNVQLVRLKNMESALDDFVYETVDELNEMTKESRSLVQEFETKNDQQNKLFPSLFDIHNIPQEPKSNRKKN